ncbi:MAG TPA: hypothetical protein VGK67_34975 [Myxococcales bacterium]|jgi:hypothetical protein
MDRRLDTLLALVLASGCFAATGEGLPGAYDAGTSTIANSLAPGPQVTDSATSGTGPCAGRTVAELIAAAESATPAVPQGIGLGRTSSDFVWAFSLSDGGFALAFEHGSGDCPAGCIDHEYWYFQTDASCVPQQIGHYAVLYDGGGNCRTVQGQSLWGIGRTVDPTSVCGADLAPRNVSGTFVLSGNGQRTACTEEMGAEPSVPVSTGLAMTVAQDPADLARGTVTFQGTGVALVDGVPLAATFSRRRFEATDQHSNLPAKCAEESWVSAAFDFEGFAPGSLSAFETRTLDCETGAYCKGDLLLNLTLP